MLLFNHKVAWMSLGARPVRSGAHANMSRKAVAVYDLASSRSETCSDKIHLSSICLSIDLSYDAVQLSRRMGSGINAFIPWL